MTHHDVPARLPTAPSKVVESLIFRVHHFPFFDKTLLDSTGEDAMNKFYGATVGIVFGMAAGMFLWPVAFTLIF